MSVFEVWILSLFQRILLDFGTVPTVWIFFFQCYHVWYILISTYIINKTPCTSLLCNVFPGTTSVVLFSGKQAKWFTIKQIYKCSCERLQLLNIIALIHHRGRRDYDCTVVGFTTTYAINVYHHWCCLFESRSERGVPHYVIKFVSDLRQVGGFLWVLRFPLSIKLTATIKLKYCWKWRHQTNKHQWHLTTCWIW